MPRFDRRVVQLSLPSEFGYEKVAMYSAGVLAEAMGFTADRVNDLQTAVSEACLNAIEHGHCKHAGVRLVVNMRGSGGELHVNVVDRGSGTIPRAKQPCMRNKIQGVESSRGWGLFLIESLVDQIRVTNRRGGGKTLRMVLRLQDAREEGAEDEETAL
jgi:serine/threonine-protein kinase RsbW